MAAELGAESAGVYSDAVGLRGDAAVRVGHVVGRYYVDVVFDGQADSGGLGFSLSGIPYWTQDVGGTPCRRSFRRGRPSPRTTKDGAWSGGRKFPSE